MKSVFESFVNSERCKTKFNYRFRICVFESFVNSERCKTLTGSVSHSLKFESFVNSERCKTYCIYRNKDRSLRALLIQKDVKQQVTRHRLIFRFESFVNSERCKTASICEL